MFSFQERSLKKLQWKLFLTLILALLIPQFALAGVPHYKFHQTRSKAKRPLKKQVKSFKPRLFENIKETPRFQFAAEKSASKKFPLSSKHRIAMVTPLSLNPLLVQEMGIFLLQTAGQADPYRIAIRKTSKEIRYLLLVRKKKYSLTLPYVLLGIGGSLFSVFALAFLPLAGLALRNSANQVSNIRTFLVFAGIFIAPALLLITVGLIYLFIRMPGRHRVNAKIRKLVAYQDLLRQKRIDWLSHGRELQQPIDRKFASVNTPFFTTNF